MWTLVQSFTVDLKNLFRVGLWPAACRKAKTITDNLSTGILSSSNKNINYDSVIKKKSLGICCQ
jgi:hypothetical protein